MRRSSPALALALLLSLAACSQSRERLRTPSIGESITAMVGPEGATIDLTGAALVIPAGAVATPTEITITAVEAEGPSWLRPQSPVLRFEPEGLAFARPIEVRIPFSGEADTATVFWSAREGDAFVARETRVEGGMAIAESTHFSQAVVGSACEGDDCCDQANGELDVLLMVDNSGSMAEEQAALAAQIPRLARALATGDSNGDGTQDFPALASVRFGIVSSDMGTGGFSLPTCEGGLHGAEHGDDGLLLTRGQSELAGCDASYPSVAEIGADSPDGALESFVTQVSCVATVGTSGCGFEQPLDAALKALTPSSSTLRFFGDTTGHGDAANAGLLRDSSMLAVVMLTDEDDCSVEDPELFSFDSAEYGAVSLNLRCSQFPEAVHSTQRYVDGLLALRDNPSDLIFASVAGVPPDVTSETSFDAILADPRMEERQNELNPEALETSCNVPGVGTAFPPRRLVQVARDLDASGAHSVVGSICQDDYSQVIDAILSRVASRARGECR